MELSLSKRHVVLFSAEPVLRPARGRPWQRFPPLLPLPLQVVPAIVALFSAPPRRGNPGRPRAAWFLRARPPPHPLPSPLTRGTSLGSEGTLGGPGGFPRARPPPSPPLQPRVRWGTGPAGVRDSGSPAAPLGTD
uniref:Uncharacterized protein n=1 Tax=Pipistrellus kuhlii TaxID=59472 RepID=A0A7J7Y9C6_PIPKU|nr:hypothetical protein mPipKuh1_010364 [Pipistrellus kuhlii]